jgi:hypothetical protein
MGEKKQSRYAGAEGVYPLSMLIWSGRAQLLPRRTQMLMTRPAKGPAQPVDEKQIHRARG